MTSARMLFKASTGAYLEGNRYDVDIDAARALLLAGKAEFVEVPAQSVNGRALTHAELARARARVLDEPLAPEPTPVEEPETP